MTTITSILDAFELVALNVTVPGSVIVSQNQTMVVVDASSLTIAGDLVTTGGRLPLALFEIVSLLELIRSCRIRSATGDWQLFDIVGVGKHCALAGHSNCRRLHQLILLLISDRRRRLRPLQWV